MKPPRSQHAAVVGAGPAGLMAAEALAEGGADVDVYDAMPSSGRKFLLAGKGGLNLTHSESFERFVERYGDRRAHLAGFLAAFGPNDVRSWADELGIATFIGSSGRVFPSDLKAAPLLRAWLHRLRARGVRLHMRHRWRGFDGDGQALHFASPDGPADVRAEATVLALGGASWPRLGSDGTWTTGLAERGVDIAPWQASNCGFDVARTDPEGTAEAGWTEHFRSRHAGAPLKNVAITLPGQSAQRGEFVITETGIEGSLVYALSAPLRDAIAAHGGATLHVDLLPARSIEWVRAEVAHPRGSRSLSTHLKSRLGLDGAKAGLLYELLSRDEMTDPLRLADSIKSLPLRAVAARPIAEAISSAGGVRFEALDDRLMLRSLPGIFCAGEMLDWEAPTGGYLLTASLATGRAAGCGALAWLAQREEGSVRADAG